MIEYNSVRGIKGVKHSCAIRMLNKTTSMGNSFYVLEYCLNLKCFIVVFLVFLCMDISIISVLLEIKN